MSEGSDLAANRPRLVGLNHIALEVGNVEEALTFYGRIFRFTLRGRQPGAAFIDMGDQSIALIEGPLRAERGHRHFGLVVDDRTAVRKLAADAGAELLDGPFLDFLDPWGNRVEVVSYADVQFTKSPHILRGMGLELSKSEKAQRELAKKEWLQRRDASRERNMDLIEDSVVPIERGLHWSPISAILPERLECRYDGHIGMVPTRLEHMTQITLDPRRVDYVQIQLRSKIAIIEHPDECPVVI